MAVTVAIHFCGAVLGNVTICRRLARKLLSASATEVVTHLCGAVVSTVRGRKPTGRREIPLLSAAQKDQVVALARRLIAAASLTGQEGEAARVVAEAMRGLGYHEVHVDEFGSVVGIVRGKRHGSVLFDGHLDTVPWATPGWSRDPLSGEVADGRLWGRGAADMKGAIAAGICGVGMLARDPAADFGTVYVSCSVAEEPAEGAALVAVCNRWRPAAVVIQEATDLAVNVGQRGRAELVLETFGRTAHSSTPHLGYNAVRAMVRLLGAIEEMKLPSDDLLGPALLEVTDVVSSPYPGLSVVPAQCRATLDRRLLTGETPDSVRGQVQEVIDRVAASDPQFRAAVRVAETRVRTYTGKELVQQAFAPAWKTPPESALVRSAVDALKHVGQSGRVSRYSFCTNGSGSAGVLGIPTIGYGPGRESEAHIVDEYLELSQLYAATEGYRALAQALSSLER